MDRIVLTFLQYLQERNDYYYHLTPGRNMVDISKEGLVANKNKNYNFSDKKVYLTTNPDLTGEFADDLSRVTKSKSKSYRRKYGRTKQNSLRVIRVHKSKLDQSKLHPDENMMRSGYYQYDDNIPAKDITFSGGSHYKKGSEKWRDYTGRRN